MENRWNAEDASAFAGPIDECVYCTRLIGSVAYFPEKYGTEIVAVALDILHRRPVPPAVFVKHQLVTPETVDHIYPNDRLMQVAAR